MPLAERPLTLNMLLEEPELLENYHQKSALQALS